MSLSASINLRKTLPILHKRKQYHDVQSLFTLQYHPSLLKLLLSYKLFVEVFCVRSPCTYSV